jgi:hypothetical protein
MPLCIDGAEVQEFSRPTSEVLLLKHSARDYLTPRGSSFFTSSSNKMNHAVANPGVDASNQLNDNVLIAT